MEEFSKLWFYILAAIIYLLINRKKTTHKESKAPDPTSIPPFIDEQEKSFKDSRNVYPKKNYNETKTSHKHDLKPLENTIEEQKVPDIYETYERISQEQNQEENLELNSFVVDNVDYESIIKKEKKENYYGKLLKNPQTLREAFVLSEILNKKYN
jgi:hypothetical protein